MTLQDRSSIMVIMNRLSTGRRGQVIACLVEGMSIRAIVRITGSRRTPSSSCWATWGQRAPSTRTGTLRNLNCYIIECDEIWAFCYSKQKNVPLEHEDTFGYGDVWTWTAIDADTKLVPSWLVGERANRRRYTSWQTSSAASGPAGFRSPRTASALPDVIDPCLAQTRVDFANSSSCTARGTDAPERTLQPAGLHGHRGADHDRRP